MARQHPSIGPELADFMAAQHVFFVASAAAGSRVNLSPRSTDSLRVIGPNAVAYLDRTGSGNETAAHIRAGGRVTIMFCAFEAAPKILRLYGRGTVLRLGGRACARVLAEHFADAKLPTGARQVVTLDVERIQTSCGFGVPLLDYRGERDALDKWTEKKGQAGIEAYWRATNTHSIDGLPTGMFEDDAAPAATPT